MLIAFHSSPYAAPLQTGTPNRGFELNVDILFTDSDSYDFVQEQKCEFHINATSPGECCSNMSLSYMRGVVNFMFAFHLLTLAPLLSHLSLASHENTSKLRQNERGEDI